MNTKEIYIGLLNGELTLNTALGFAMINNSLTDEEKAWISSEMLGYEEKVNLPSYRQLPCGVKAKVQSLFDGAIQDILMGGESMAQLDSFLQDKIGLSIYKMYVTQGVEYIEQQVNCHSGGSIIMRFDNGPGQELVESLKNLERIHNFTTLFTFQETSVAYLQYALTVIKNRLLSILKSHMEPAKVDFESTSGQDSKEVFISYGWEDEDHTDWVHNLARSLSDFFTVKIDEKLPFGGDLNVFMEQNVANADRVILILTPTYKHKADNRENGVGYESVIISSELFKNQQTNKFIPIIRKGSIQDSYPIYLGNRKGLFMTDDATYDDKFKELIEDIRCN